MKTPVWLRARRWLIVFTIIFILIWSAVGTETDVRKFSDIDSTVHFIATRWFPLDWSVLPKAVHQAMITLQIAITGTFWALVVALPAAFLAAWNTSPHPAIYHLVRAVLSFVRSVPEIVWALLFVPTIGLGPFGGVLAIFLHNIGVLGKLFSELVEAAEKGQQEAVISVGAKKVLVILFGIIPQIVPNMLSHYFYRLEVGVRTSLILGFIGAGGIGGMLFIDFNLQNYTSVGVEVLVIMALVVFVDYLGAYVRSRVI